MIRVVTWIISLLILIFIIFLAELTITDFKPKEKMMLYSAVDQEGLLPADKEFTIATWNIGYFGLGQQMDFFYDGGKKVRPPKEDYESYMQGGLEFLATLDPVDFILLQEVDLHSKRSYYYNQYQEIEQQLPSHYSFVAVNYDVRYVPVPLTHPMGRVESGIAQFDLFKGSERYRGALPGEYSWPVRLFMLDRCFIFSRYKLDSGKDLVIINTHNEAFDAGEMRNQQMEFLRNIMLQEYMKGNYVVAGGDWNMNPAGFREKTFVTGDVPMSIEPAIDPAFFPGGWNWAYDPFLPTNRSVIDAYSRGKTRTTIIDFFITSPNIEVLNTYTIDLKFQWSDHQPVLMKFKCITQD